MQGLMEKLEAFNVDETKVGNLAVWHSCKKGMLDIIRQHEAEQQGDAVESIRHGLEMAEIFAIKNAHALNAAPVLTAIKDAKAAIAAMPLQNVPSNAQTAAASPETLIEKLQQFQEINYDIGYQDGKGPVQTSPRLQEREALFCELAEYLQQREISVITGYMVTWDKMDREYFVTEKEAKARKHDLDENGWLGVTIHPLYSAPKREIGRLELAFRDLEYVNGARAGWNAALSDDADATEHEDAMQRRRNEAMKVINEIEGQKP